MNCLAAAFAAEHFAANGGGRRQIGAAKCCIAGADGQAWPVGRRGVAFRCGRVMSRWIACLRFPQCRGGGVRCRLGRAAPARRERGGRCVDIVAAAHGRISGRSWMEVRDRAVFGPFGWSRAFVRRRETRPRHLVHDRRRLAGADGSQRSFAGLVHRELAIECGQLEGTALWSQRAGDRELASGVVQAPGGVDQQGDS